MFIYNADNIIKMLKTHKVTLWFYNKGYSEGYVEFLPLNNTDETFYVIVRNGSLIQDFNDLFQKLLNESRNITFNDISCLGIYNDYIINTLNSSKIDLPDLKCSFNITFRENQYEFLKELLQLNIQMESITSNKMNSYRTYRFYELTGRYSDLNRKRYEIQYRDSAVASGKVELKAVIKDENLCTAVPLPSLRELLLKKFFSECSDVDEVRRTRFPAQPQDTPSVSSITSRVRNLNI